MVKGIGEIAKSGILNTYVKLKTRRKLMTSLAVLKLTPGGRSEFD